MSLDQISISDLGKSLLEIEAEIAQNHSQIAYMQTQIGLLRDKNDVLVRLSQDLCKLNIPRTYHYTNKDLY